MDVRSIMSPSPYCVALDTPVEAARSLMDSQDIRHLPVVAHDRVVGVVSDRDLYPTDQELMGAPSGSLGPSSRTVADVLQDRLSTLTPEDSLLTASTQCLAQKDGCLPVLRDAQLVGILSEMDLVVTLMRSLRESAGADDAPQPTVEELMTPFPMEASPETTVTEAIGMCRMLHARHLPVVNGGQLAGIVSDRDLRRCAAAGRAPTTTLDEIMESEPLTIEPSQTLREAAELMATAKISALPVVEDAQLIGILTLTDLLEHFIHSYHPSTTPHGG